MDLFLGIIALIFIIVAVVVDLRRKEVPNWVSFSLIAFALVYRLSEGVLSGAWLSLVYSILNGAILFGVGFGLYSVKSLGGGDVKLMAGIGLSLPTIGFYSSLFELGVYLGLLLISGAVYGLVVSLYFVVKDFFRFLDNVTIEIKRYFKWIITILFVLLVLFFMDNTFLMSLSLILLVFCLVLMRPLDKMMIILKSPKELQPGEWLYKSVNVKGRVIESNMHGLSWKNIQLLKKANKKVWIKEGIAFTPAFLIAQIIMLFFEVVLLSPLSEFLLSLLQSFQVLVS